MPDGTPRLPAGCDVRTIQLPSSEQDRPSVAGQHVPEDLPAKPGAAVLGVGRHVGVTAGRAETRINRSRPDTGVAEDVRRPPVDVPANLADRTSGSACEPRQMQGSMKSRPDVGAADGLNQYQRGHDGDDQADLVLQLRRMSPRGSKPWISCGSNRTTGGLESQAPTP
jgi:hypothetical protein